MQLKLTGLASAMGARLPVLLRDACGFAGLCFVVYGVFTIYAPAGWIVAGLLSVACAAAGGRGDAGPPK